MPIRCSNFDEDCKEYASRIKEIVENYIGRIDRVRFDSINKVRKRTWSDENSIFNAIDAANGNVETAIEILRTASPVSMDSLLSSPNNTFVPIATVMKCVDDDFRPLTVAPRDYDYSSTRDYEFAKYIRDNVETLVPRFFDSCKMWNGNIKILPEQILLAIFNTHVSNSLITTWCISQRSAGSNVTIQPNASSSVRISTTSPGSGKTITAGLTAMRLLNDSEILAAHVASRQQTTVPVDDCGFSTLPRPHNPVVKVVIFVAPIALKAQTKAALTEVVSGTDTLLWYDIGGRNLKSVAEQAKPVIWILPQNQSTTAMLRETPNLDFVAMIVDEGNTSMHKNGYSPAAKPLVYFYLQATPASLDVMMASRPDHPVRNALRSHSFAKSTSAPSSYYFYESAFLRAQLMFTPPFLRTAMNKAAMQRMPIGFSVYNLKCNFTNFRSATTGQAADHLAPVSIKTFLKDVLRPHAANYGHITPAQYETLTSGMGCASAIDPDAISSVLQSAHDLIFVPPSASEETARAVRSEKATLMRLKANMDGLFDKTVECPILLEPLTRDSAVVLSCCLNVISKEANAGLRTLTCPICRAKRKGLVAFEKKQAKETEATSPEFAYTSSETLSDTVERITALNKPPVQAISHLLIATMTKLPNARILVMSQRRTSNFSLAAGLREIQAAVKSRFPSVDFVDASGRRKVSVEKFNSPMIFTNPIVLLLDLDSRSNTAAGLDLRDADLSILAGSARADLKTQVIFRSCRMGTTTGSQPKPIVSFT